MTLGIVLIITLVVMLIAAAPYWPFSRAWGFAPVGIIAAILVIVIILQLDGRL